MLQRTLVSFCVFFGATVFAARDCAPALAGLAAKDPTVGRRLLSELDANRAPWRHLDSEQPYFYLGSTPREMALGLPARKQPVLPARLRELGEKELVRLAKRLDRDTLEFEMWPTYGTWGSKTWTIARYRESADHAWKWLDDSYYPRALKEGPADPTTIVLPEFLDPSTPEARERLFENFPRDLYQRPELGYAVWLTPDRHQVLAAWLPPTELKKYAKAFRDSKAVVASVAPPARFNGKPLTFVVRVVGGKVQWPGELGWDSETRTPPFPAEPSERWVRWPSDFRERYAADIERFSGQEPIQSPLSGRKIDFGKLGVGQKNNQLIDLVHYLKSEYENLGYGRTPGFETEVQSFRWDGRPMANLIVRIRGSLPRGRNKPVILTDHIDKAIAEDIYEKTGKRITNPGADDNGTATATLRRAAEILYERYRKSPPLHDIWIVHFTGEEYPGSCLGSRYFVSDLLKRRQDIGININLDMLGHRTKGDKVFQINPGENAVSMAAANVALGAALAQGGGWKPTLRFPWSRRSYYLQTDSAIFDWAGYPTFLINEHINLARRINPNYHQSTDLPTYVDMAYAVVQAKTAIETAVRFAEGQASLNAR